MLSNTQYDAIMRIYQDRQAKSQRELDERRRSVYEQIPRLPEIDQEIASASVRKALFLLGDAGGRDVDIDQTIRDLAHERQVLLQIHGFRADALEPRYVCPICRDTGYVGDEKCSCFRQMEIDLLYSRSNMADSLKEESFSGFSLDYYSPDRIQSGSGRSERAEASSALQAAQTFVDEFDARLASGEPENLCFYGDVGVGKTYLSRCIGGALLKKGRSVLYLSAHDLFEQLGTAIFSSSGEQKEFRDYIFTSELLIIDDLGTELTNSFVVSSLFMIVNERLMQKKSTVISTNLSLEKFRDIFTERTFSRIMGSYRLIHLSGRDIRIQKKIHGGK